MEIVYFGHSQQFKILSSFREDTELAAIDSNIFTPRLTPMVGEVNFALIIHETTGQ